MDDSTQIARKEDLIGNSRNWNEDFQKVLQIKDSTQRAEAISNLSQDFTEVASKNFRFFFFCSNMDENLI